MKLQNTYTEKVKVYTSYTCLEVFFHLVDFALYVAISTDQPLSRSVHFILILFPIPIPFSTLFSSSIASMRTDQYLRWLCQVQFTQFVFSMVLILSLPGQMIATSQGFSILNSTVCRLLRAVYWKAYDDHIETLLKPCLGNLLPLPDKKVLGSNLMI